MFLGTCPRVKYSKRIADLKLTLSYTDQSEYNQ